MSWLARSLANSLGIDDDGQHNHDASRNVHDDESSFSGRLNQQFRQQEEEDEDQSHGVKEDLSEFRETLTRQLTGVATFLAPPPPPPPPPQVVAPYKYRNQITVSEFDPSELSDPSVSGDDGLSEQDQVAGESGDPSVVGGVPTVEIHKAVGVTDEVLSFAGNIAHHPETWLDFPIDEEDDVDDFDMSESQKEHAITVESLTPRLRALRIELCPAHMSVGYFWKVYFVLLHSRLNKHDAELLSTSQVVEARSEWMRELQKRTKEELERQCYYKENAFLHDELGPSSPCFQQPNTYSAWTFVSEPACSSVSCDSETKEHTVTSSETEFVDKSVILEKPAMKTVVEKNIMAVSSPGLLLHSFDDDDDDDDWPEDELLEDGKCGPTIPLGIEEEVSFSDLEDDECSIHTKYSMSFKD